MLATLSTAPPQARQAQPLPGAIPTDPPLSGSDGVPRSPELKKSASTIAPRTTTSTSGARTMTSRGIQSDAANHRSLAFTSAGDPLQQVAEDEPVPLHDLPTFA